MALVYSDCGGAVRYQLRLLWLVACTALLLPLCGLTADEEDASDAGCLPKPVVAAPAFVCAACHPDDALQRWDSQRGQACTPYCAGCHLKTQMSRHHKVGLLLLGEPDAPLRLTAEHKNACFTCHDLARPRYDSVRWKAASLFDKMFRQEARYKTYFLVQRNDSGQLCLNCH
jgi:hypothetical protein